MDFDKCGRTEAAQLDSDAMSSTPTQAEQQGGRKNDENQIEAFEFKKKEKVAETRNQSSSNLAVLR